MFYELAFDGLRKKFGKAYERMINDFEQANGDFDAVQEVRRRYTKRLRRMYKESEFIKLEGALEESKLLFESALLVLIEGITAIEGEQQTKSIEKFQRLIRESNDKLEEARKIGGSKHTR